MATWSWDKVEGQRWNGAHVSEYWKIHTQDDHNWIEHFHLYRVVWREECKKNWKAYIMPPLSGNDIDDYNCKIVCQVSNATVSQWTLNGHSILKLFQINPIEL